MAKKNKMASSSRTEINKSEIKTRINRNSKIETMKHILTILLSVITATVFGQTFEGEITYQNSYTSKLPNIETEQFNTMMGTTQKYSIKIGDYKSSSNGSLFQRQLYINKNNKLYNKMSNSETVYWNDANINPDSIINIELNEDVTEILGYKCDEVVLYCLSGVQKYYYNQEIGVDISLFKNHLFGNWYDFLKVSKSLPLKSIIENQQFTLVSVATEIKEMKLDKQEFQLPENTQVAKSPY
ncbi:hypothetical protein [Cyclobacterium salsum]|uniref:hypothetical protein n=1 Tax=Cyclobacterium salsum TaxID=2666329 RepID=UPI001F415BB8|nr:hypothetical protein [Cyclobacterium salsum]